MAIFSHLILLFAAIAAAAPAASTTTGTAVEPRTDNHNATEDAPHSNSFYLECDSNYHECLYDYSSRCDYYGNVLTNSIWCYNHCTCEYACSNFGCCKFNPTPDDDPLQVEEDKRNCNLGPSCCG
ncbi:hypothetical protein GE09DRAFT_1078805 [Coniochaeta sp. 2T2.1]|nr:hypothetical protein GE09DRAFT_1078805 [Coniochaeta sp. 2T2.1]